MFSPSEEQQIIMNAISSGKNVIVDACAGSGKSTTILSCAKALPELQFRQLTFNKMLQEEVKESIHKHNINNIQVFTYHGLAVKYYDSQCHNDMGIRRVLRENMSPRVPIEPFDVMVVDEAQDMTKLYHQVIWKFMMDMGKPILLLILGDEKQGLYEFKGADTRFLTMAEHCWKHFPNLRTTEFEHHTLLTSYRITDTMRDFINHVMLGYERIRSCKAGNEVIYYKKSIKDIANIFFLRIQTLLLRDNAKYEDFFILFRSVRSNNIMVRYLENFFVERGIPCFVPNNDNKDELDTRVIQGKVVFSTFHASKGRQRPYVFVMGFDSTHFQYFATDKDPNECPNELYVACSRATKQLLVVEGKDKSTSILPFLQLTHNQMMRTPYIKFQGTPTGKVLIPEKPVENNEKRRKVTPTDLTRFLPESALDILSPLVDNVFETITVHDNDNILPIHSIHKTYTGNFEDISDLNGIVLPIMFCDLLRQESGLNKIPIMQNMIHANIQTLEEGRHIFLRNLVDAMPCICDSISDYLYVACLLVATNECLYSRLKQIPVDDYTWLNDDIVQDCFLRLEEKLGHECRNKKWYSEYSIIRQEQEVEHITIDAILSRHFPDCLYRFSARADLLTELSIWELKCTSNLTLEHKLQLVLYAWLYQSRYGEKKEKEYHLFNIKTKEHLKLCASHSQLTTIVVEILKGKQTIPTLNDDDFVNSLITVH